MGGPCERVNSPSPGGSGAWVVLRVNFSQPLAIDVRVDLGGADVGVAEHRLHRPQVGAPLEQVGREAVAKLVRADVLPDTCGQGQALEPCPEGHPAHTAATPGYEQVRAVPAVEELGAAGFQVGQD